MKVYTQSAQLIKYIVTGGLTTGVNYLIYFILLGAAGDAAQQSRVYLAANSAAWLGAVLFAYVMNRKLVFHSERAIVHEFLEFAGLRLATLAVENLLLYLLIDVWQWQSPLEARCQCRHRRCELCRVQTADLSRGRNKAHRRTYLKHI